MNGPFSWLSAAEWPIHPGRAAVCKRAYPNIVRKSGGTIADSAVDTTDTRLAPEPSFAIMVWARGTGPTPPPSVCRVACGAGETTPGFPGATILRLAPLTAARERKRAGRRWPPSARVVGDPVEVPGIEPGSFSASPVLLRAQPAVLFSAPAITQARRRQAQPLFDFLACPVAGPAS